MRPLSTTIRPALPVSLPLTLDIMQRGLRDPAIRWVGDAWWRVMQTPLGATSVRVTQHADEIVVDAWGPGAELVIDGAPALVGARDDLEGWEPARHPLVRQLDRHLGGMRFGAAPPVLEHTVAAVLEQKITSAEAYRAWGRIVRGWGEPAPGPAPSGMMAPPTAAKLAATPYFAFHPYGVERRRAEVIRNLASRASRVEEAASMPDDGGRRRLQAFVGVGPWTSAKVAMIAWADADAVMVGDYHLPGMVVRAFTGKQGGDDDAMLELLEPFAPHRGRVARLIKHAGFAAERHGPRMPIRSYEKL